MTSGLRSYYVVVLPVLLLGSNAKCDVIRRYVQGGEFKSIAVKNWRFFAKGSGYC